MSLTTIRPTDPPHIQTARRELRSLQKKERACDEESEARNKQRVDLENQCGELEERIRRVKQALRRVHNEEVQHQERKVIRASKMANLEAELVDWDRCEERRRTQERRRREEQERKARELHERRESTSVGIKRERDIDGSSLVDGSVWPRMRYSTVGRSSFQLNPDIRHLSFHMSSTDESDANDPQSISTMSTKCSKSKPCEKDFAVESKYPCRWCTTHKLVCKRKEEVTVNEQGILVDVGGAPTMRTQRNTRCFNCTRKSPKGGCTLPPPDPDPAVAPAAPQKGEEYNEEDWLEYVDPVEMVESGGEEQPKKKGCVGHPTPCQRKLEPRFKKGVLVGWDSASASGTRCFRYRVRGIRCGVTRIPKDPLAKEGDSSPASEEHSESDEDRKPKRVKCEDGDTGRGPTLYQLERRSEEAAPSARADDESEDSELEIPTSHRG
ncbi:hypothetical protein CC1G_11417 [Coprinopsis cinerea okayama7|uniref:Uncharacterized protein n=1 Tax=Coprinopsis cinerea (strain Okayama-7 / 130 / ATCC MYA-4618 / FGSC 9003) TaxID=240176 RepID=A8N486_COPC7|nr:hypothetical protein CC1G_11417 [Coprinopsis cinerea okayama7\|eukprot:XP_001829681.2 hypothetical protein CC1G_11417 [Coprinopsis cinerea okayama7\